MLLIKFRCFHCQHTNHQNLGMPGFEVVEYIWDSFSGAYCHLIEFPDHHVDAEIVEENE